MMYLSHSKRELVLLADRETLQIKITDFGLAKTEQRDQSFGSQCGTPNYGEFASMYYNELHVVNQSYI